MSIENFFPTLIIWFFNLEIILGPIEDEGQVSLASVTWYHNEEVEDGEEIHLGVGFWLYWFVTDPPMFHLQVSPKIDATLLWLSPGESDGPSNTDTI